MGYGVRATLALLATLMMGKKKRPLPAVLKELVGSLFSIAATKFGLFLASYIGGFKGIQCALRYLRQTDDGINAAIAGGIAGSSFLILADRTSPYDPNGTSELLPYAVYLMLRALEAVWNRLDTSGYVKSLPNFNAFLFAISTGTMFWAYSAEPESLRPSYRRFVYKMSGGREIGPAIFGRTTAPPKIKL